MNPSIEIAIEELRASQYIYIEASKATSKARDFLRNADHAQNVALAKLDEAKEALFGAIADIS